MNQEPLSFFLSLFTSLAWLEINRIINLASWLVVMVQLTRWLLEPRQTMSQSCLKLEVTQLRCLPDLKMLQA